MSTRLTDEQTQPKTRSSRYGKASCFLFGVAVLGLIATTLFDSFFAALSPTGERWLSMIILLLPSAAGVLAALRGLFGGDQWKRWTIVGLILNVPFALFFGLILAIAG